MKMTMESGREMDITMIMMGNIGYKDTLDFFIERKLVVYNDNDGWGEKGGYRRTPTQDTPLPLLHITRL